MEKDPVCGMDVDPQSAVGKSEYKGQIYYEVIETYFPVKGKYPENRAKVTRHSCRFLARCDINVAPHIL